MKDIQAVSAHRQLRDRNPLTPLLKETDLKPLHKCPLMRWHMALNLFVLVVSAGSIGEKTLILCKLLNVVVKGGADPAGKGLTLVVRAATVQTYRLRRLNGGRNVQDLLGWVASPSDSCGRPGPLLSAIALARCSSKIVYS